MTPDIISDLRAGRLVVVPSEPTEPMLEAYWCSTGESKEMRDRTRDYGRRKWSTMLSASPDHTAALVARVEELERERGSNWKLAEDERHDANHWHAEWEAERAARLAAEQRYAEAVEALEKIANPGTVAGMHEQDRAAKLQGIAFRAARQIVAKEAGDAGE